MNPDYEEAPHGIRCKRCGVEFIGIHVCMVKNL